MKEHFFIVCCCLVLGFLLVSCGKSKRPAPDYDHRRTARFVKACKRSRGEVSQEVLEEWKALVSLYPDENFPVLAHRLVQKKLLIQEANGFLSMVELHRLLEMVRQSEKDGTACPELLAFSKYKDSLDQLRLFVSKMPWTDSRTLQVNLQLLDQHRKVLEQSSAYVDFRAGQERELSRLQAQEKRIRRVRVLNELDRALISGEGLSQASGRFLRYCGEDAQELASRCLGADSVSSLRELHASSVGDRESRQAFEIIGLYRWDRLDVALRREWLRLLGNARPLTLSGSWLSVRYGLHADADEVFLGLLSHDCPPCKPSPGIVRDMLGTRLMPSIQYQAWCWRSPCPGVTEIAARLLQIGQRVASPRNHSK